MSGSLGRRFLLVVVATTFLVAATIGGVSIWLTRDRFVQVQADQLTALSAFTARELFHELELRSHVLLNLARTPVVHDYPVTHRTLALKEFLTEENGVFQEIELISSDGRVEVDAERTPMERTADLVRMGGEVSAALRAPGEVRWEVVADKPDAGAQFVFTLGLKQYYGDIVWGCLRAEVPLVEISRHIAALKHEQGSLYLVHPRAGVLALAEGPDGPPPSAELAAALQERRRPAGSQPAREIDVGSARFLTTEARVEGTDWRVVAVIDHGSFYALATNLGWLLALLTTGCILSGGWAAYWLGRRITSPLQRIVSATEQAAAGHLLEIDNLRAPGEIRGMLETFNSMVRNLRQTTVSRDYLEGILRSMREALFVVGLDGVIQRVNPAGAGLLGYDPLELEGRPVLEIFANSDQPWLDLVSRGTASVSERVFRHRDGSSLLVLFSWTRYNDIDGQTKGLICIAQAAGPQAPPVVGRPSRLRGAAGRTRSHSQEAGTDNEKARKG